jgi:transcriptional regulator with XRE-family HTH domain
MSAENARPAIPDPTGASTPAEFGQRLLALMRSQRLSVDSLVRRSRDGGVPISRATVYNLARGTGVPRRDSVVAFLRACGAPPRVQVRWLMTFDEVYARRDQAAPTPHARADADAASTRRQPALR